MTTPAETIAEIDAALAPLLKTASANAGPVNYSQLVAVLQAVRQALAHVVYAVHPLGQGPSVAAQALGVRREAEKAGMVAGELARAPFDPAAAAKGNMTGANSPKPLF